MPRLEELPGNRRDPAAAPEEQDTRSPFGFFFLWFVLPLLVLLLLHWLGAPSWLSP